MTRADDGWTAGEYRALRILVQQGKRKRPALAAERKLAVALNTLVHRGLASFEHSTQTYVPTVIGRSKAAQLGIRDRRQASA